MGLTQRSSYHSPFLKIIPWLVPEQVLDAVRPGCRVEVNLGKNKKYAGIVKRLHNEKPEFFEPKEILNVLDTEPVVYEEQLQLWEWMASYYMCSEGEVMSAALPSHLSYQVKPLLFLTRNMVMTFLPWIMMNTWWQKLC